MQAPSRAGALRDYAQLPLYRRKGVVQVLAFLDSPPAGQDPVLGPPFAVQGLHDRVKGPVLAVAEDGELGHAWPMVDGVIPPFACADSAAVKGEQEVQFAAAEEQMAGNIIRQL